MTALEDKLIWQQVLAMEQMRADLAAMNPTDRARVHHLTAKGLPLQVALNAVKAGVRPYLASWERPRKELANLNLPTPNAPRGRKLTRRQRRKA